MFLKRRSNVLFRNFGSFGYLTDNRNFGYGWRNDRKETTGDIVVSQSGAVFLSALSREPQDFDDVVARISADFIEVDPKELREDAREFYDTLECGGFIIAAGTKEECNRKDARFSYRNMVSETNAQASFRENKTPALSTQEFLETYSDGQPLLTSVHIEITGRCNENCIHCYFPAASRNQEMKLDTFGMILRQCAEMKVLNITISGGEPTLHRDLLKILKMCREREFSVNLLSNLSFLDSDVLLEMYANQMLCVQVSLYSMDPTVHDGITGVKGSFERTMGSILKLRDCDIPMQIFCPIMKSNMRSYLAMEEWARNNNLNVETDYVVLARHDHSVDNLRCRLSIEEVEQIVRSRIQSDDDYLLQVERSVDRSVGASLDDNICSVCQSSICINEKGEVYPCAGWQSYIVGNVTKTPLRDIWYSSEGVTHLRSMRRRDIPECIQCSDRDYCTLCLVRNANEDASGNPLVPNRFYCSVAKLHKKLSCDQQ